MLEKQPVTTVPHTSPVTHNIKHTRNMSLFTKENYIWMLGGLVLIAIGMLLMGGGKSSDPNVFDPKEVYSTTRITIAPLLIVVGLAIDVFGIFKKPKERN